MLRQEDEQHAQETHGGIIEYGMVRLSFTSLGWGTERPVKEKDKETSGQAQLFVHAPQALIRAKPLKGAHPVPPDETERQMVKLGLNTPQ